MLVGYQANSQCIPVYNKAYFMPMNVFTSSVVVNANRENYEVNDKLITLNQKNKILAQLEQTSYNYHRTIVAQDWTLEFT